jgi:hypothetical protein
MADNGVNPYMSYGFDDPNPPGGAASDAEKKSYVKSVLAYSDAVFSVLENSNLRDERLWIEMTTTFRQEAILALTANRLIS